MSKIELKDHAKLSAYWTSCQPELVVASLKKKFHYPPASEASRGVYYQTPNRMNIRHRKLVYGLFVHIKSVFEQWINYRPCDWYSNGIHLIVLNKDTKIVWVSNSSRLPPSNFQILTVC